MNARLTPAELRALREETPLGVLGAPEDVAETVKFLASGGAKFITGQVISPNGGLL
jgi:3-oxoacyl-[acyl-carrier protein] reductase